MFRSVLLTVVLGCVYLVSSMAAAQTGPSGPDDPAVVGAWDPPQTWQVIAIHSATLPTGKVLQYAYPSGGSMLWDPATGKFEEANISTDLFCSGHSFLPDGKLLVTGGNDYACDFQGRVDVWEYDPFTQIWTQQKDMVDARWYPTNVELADGRTVIFTGLDLNCEINPNIELYTPGQGVEVIDTDSPVSLYPNMHLLSNGLIAMVGSSQSTYTYDVDNNHWTYIDNTNWNRWRGASTSVLIPGRTDEILMIGGGDGDGAANVTATCEIIDFKDGQPQWQYTSPMHHARKHVDAAILPDKSVFICGGGITGLYNDPVLTPELFNPETETWIQLPPHTHGRMYHSTTVLLPDGRVLIAGQNDGASAYTGEIYSPPYLFRGPRPVIEYAPNAVSYDQEFLIDTQQAPSIQSICLIALTATTHSINMTQRYVELEFVMEGPDQLRATAPEHGNLAPPGYYMLFIRDDDDVPSVASMVRLGTVTTETSVATNVNAIRGFQVGGKLASTYESDDSFLQFVPGLTVTSTEPPVRLEFASTLPNDQPATLKFSLESSVNSFNVFQTVEMYNYTTGQYDLVDIRGATIDDSVALIDPGGDVSRFIEPGTGNVQSRIAWFANGPVLPSPWTVDIDHIFWIETF